MKTLRDEAVDARKNDIENIILDNKGADAVTAALAEYVETELDLASVDVLRRQATVDRISADSNWRRVSQVYADILRVVVNGGDFFERLAKIETARADFYAAFIKRELRGGRLQLGSDEQQKFRRVEKDSAAVRLTGGEITEELLAQRSRFENLERQRDRLLAEIAQRRGVERSHTSAVLRKVQ